MRRVMMTRTTEERRRRRSFKTDSILRRIVLQLLLLTVKPIIAIRFGLRFTTLSMRRAVAIRYFDPMFLLHFVCLFFNE